MPPYCLNQACALFLILCYFVRLFICQHWRLWRANFVSPCQALQFKQELGISSTCLKSLFYLLRRPVPNPVMFFITAFPWSTPATPVRLIRICVQAHSAVSDTFLHLLLLDQSQAKGLLLGVTASAVPTGTQQVCSLTHLQYSACTLQSKIIVNM